ncbi:hypothetical protein OPV22_007642 [Ensete ventricosum]|uniref:Uncharacterized protein n=1 Tax=Ensete ventricosum TaxID=4639 RepID=A0AAV8Q953_ENSVE|nr:hypothetical protein OPV22_007642 [Ensete ventricosum]
MSLPFQQQQQLPPPPPPVYAYRSHGGSVGPVIAVLAVIAVLGVIAGILGRLCSGRTIMGYGHYDLEGWVERKCASCIDGRLEVPPQPRRPSASPTGRTLPPPPPPSAEAPQAKQSERRPDAPAGAAES